MAVALGAQAGLYLTLRRISVATLPAWAHGHVFHPPSPGAINPVVGVSLVAGPAIAGAAADDAAPPPLPQPALQPVPVVPVSPPALPGGAGGDPSP